MKRVTAGTLTAILILAVVALAGQSAGLESADAARKGKVREFEGKVVKVNKSKRTFVQRKKGGGKVKIKVKKATRYDDIRGFKAIRKGMRLETKARYNGKKWVAKKIERDDRDD